MKDNKSKRNKILKISGLIGLFILVFGISFALFTVTLNGTKKNRIKTGKLDVIIDNESASGISLEGAVPISAEDGQTTVTPYTFDIVNQGNIGAVYDLYFVLDDTTTLDPSNVYFHLVKNDTVDEILSFPKQTTQAELTTLLADTGDETFAIDNPNNNYIYTSKKLSDAAVSINNQTVYKLNASSIDVDTTHSYSLQMWIKYSAGNDAMNKVFEGSIRVEASQASKDTAYEKEIFVLANNAVGSFETNTCETNGDMQYAQGNAGFTYMKYYSDHTLHFTGNGSVGINGDDYNDYYNKNLWDFDAAATEFNKLITKYNINVQPFEDGAEIEDAMNNGSAKWSTFTSACEANESCMQDVMAAYGAIIVPYKAVYYEDGYIGNANTKSAKKVYFSKTIERITFGDCYTDNGQSVLEEVTYTNIKPTSTFATSIYNIGQICGYNVTSGVSRLYTPEFGKLAVVIDFDDVACTTWTKLDLPDTLSRIAVYDSGEAPNLDVTIAARQADVLRNPNVFNNAKSVTWLNN